MNTLFLSENLSHSIDGAGGGRGAGGRNAVFDLCLRTGEIPYQEPPLQMQQMQEARSSQQGLLPPRSDTGAGGVGMQYPERIAPTNVTDHCGDDGNSFANLIIKLLLCSSKVAQSDSEIDLWHGNQVSCEFNSLVAEMASQQITLSDPDVLEIFRKMLKAASEVSERICSKPATEVGKDDKHNPVYKYHLSLTIVDMLRTVAEQHSNEFRPEYAKDCKLPFAMTSHTCNILRHQRLPNHCVHAYAAGDRMFENMNIGIRALKRMSQQPDHALYNILEKGAQCVSESIICLLLPTLFDHRRMKALTSIAYRFYDVDGVLPNTKRELFNTLLCEIYGSSSSVISAQRVVKTIMSIVAMGHHQLSKKYVEQGLAQGKSKEQSMGEARASKGWCELNQLVVDAHKVVLKHLPADCAEGKDEDCTADAETGEHGDGAKKKSRHTSAPAANNALYSLVAEWFNTTARDHELFTALHAALSAPVFVLNDKFDKANGRLCKQWKDYVSESAAEAYSVWEVASFLVGARLELYQDGRFSELAGTNILVCAMVCLIGAVGDLINPMIGGPFVFHCPIKKGVGRLHKKLFIATRIYKVKLTTRIVPGTKGDTGKTCRTTTISRALVNSVRQRGFTRNTHEPSGLMQSRVRTSLFYLAICEELRRDLHTGANVLSKCGHDVSPHVAQGRKHQRCAFIGGMQAQPFVAGRAHHLIEREKERESDDVDKDMTRPTAGNTDKPFRDISGCAVAVTLLPLAGIAFYRAIDSLVTTSSNNNEKNPNDEGDKLWFKSTTGRGVNQFVAELRNLTNSTFDLNHLRTNDQPGLFHVGLHECEVMMLQQRSFVNSFCDMVENNPALWEGLGLSFAVQDSAKKRETSSRNSRDDDLDECEQLKRPRFEEDDHDHDFSSSSDGEFDF